MNPAIWIAIYLPIIVAVIVAVRNKRQMMKHIVLKKKSGIKGVGFMNELIKNCLGKECVVYTFEGTQIKGVIEATESNWVSISTSKGPQIVNLDFISRIRQCAKSKNDN